jgi:hypothetical protein
MTPCAERRMDFGEGGRTRHRRFLHGCRVAGAALSTLFDRALDLRGIMSLR